MWTITSDNYTIYDPRVETYQVGTPTLKIAENRAETASFTVYRNHPNISHLDKLSSTVEIAEGANILFRGRVIDDVMNFMGYHRITCEGALAFLNDSVVRPFAFPEDFLTDPDYQDAADHGNVVEYFLGWLIDEHNAQVTADRQLTLGTVTVTDPNNYITRSSENYANTMEIISDKLFDSDLGGHLYVRYDNTHAYVDYVDTFSTTSVQDVAFRENLLDLENQIDATETYTVILPLGAKDDESGRRLTIADLPDGSITADLVKDGDQIYSLAGVASYGRICAPTDDTTWDDVTLALNLQTRGAQYLANYAAKLTQTITVKAADLYPIGESLGMFLPFTNVNVISAAHGLSTAYALTEIEYHLDAPQDTEITLGATVRTLTGANAQRQADMASIRNDITENAQAITQLNQTVIDQSTSILQSAEQIVLQALTDYVSTGDFQNYQETVSAALSVMSDQIVMNFTTTTNSITATNDEVARIYNERIQYIRFENGDIVLGEQGNELTLRISNDRISFVQDNLEVAYFSDQKLYVTNGEFLTSLNLGVFGFVPAQNGSLSFKKVK